MSKKNTPRPLTPRQRRPADYPVDALGPILSSAAKAIRDKVQAALAICAQSALAVAALAVQAHANVVLPNGHAKPISLFFIGVAASGDRKSACDTEALAPIRAREDALVKKHDAERSRYLIQITGWKHAHKAALNKHQSDPAALNLP
jgi:hypothetical protein